MKDNQSKMYTKDCDEVLLSPFQAQPPPELAAECWFYAGRRRAALAMKEEDGLQMNEA